MSATANWKLRTIVLAMTASLFVACAPANSSCPPVAAYDRDTLAQAAAELERLGPNSATARLIADYGVLRAQVRACR
jgi:hypothetical protein